MVLTAAAVYASHSPVSQQQPQFLRPPRVKEIAQRQHEPLN
ncbi:MAG: hypothetical protein KatS3mg114_0410 [Planctomycetaceae bacterium]|nr:MAG: hypothetical protein KatS3mg114_0410 [Planctomycetaceae bacterium]